MYIYNGKLDYDLYAKNECITLVFPVGFALHDPVCGHWQWSTDGGGYHQVNTSEPGLVTAVSKTMDQYSLQVALDYYAFEITLAPDRRSVTLLMTSPRDGRSSPATLTLCYADSIQIPTTVTYTGKLNYLNYAKNEMVTLILPTGGISPDAPVGLFYQFTVDGAGVQKRNEVAVGTLSGVSKAADGTVTADFKSSYYRYKFTFSANEDTVSAVMISPHPDSPSESHTFALERARSKPRMGAKKALIVRFNTGSDTGIFLVKDMLTKHLGFADADVEMLYFDVDEYGGKKSRTGGQDPPTAKRFLEKFVSMLQGAHPGDVRFLYVDAHGTVRDDSDDSGEPDGMDEGWTLAGSDDGRLKEVVYDDLLSKTINENFKPGVNLTILTSSCMGGGMLDTHDHTPGILLAGCHETQFNVKALNINDGSRRVAVEPWMYVITRTISKRVGSKRGVPTYTELFNEAKRSLKSLFNSGQISTTQYLGPSPDETRPSPRDMASDPIVSHQDPQLAFYEGFINPDTERFLFPIAAPPGGDVSPDAKTRRYPSKDEL